MEERDIIQSCLRGDRSAFAKLYKQHASIFYGMVLRYARNKSDGDDILQEGFSKIFLNLHKFNFEGSFEGWMKRIMINQALQYYKKKNTIMYVEDYSQSINLASHQNPTEQLNYEELLGYVNQLSDGCRMVFNLYAIEGFAHKEIAEMLQISEGTSKSQLNYARKQLKEKIENECLPGRHLKKAIG